jgi:hypothetical protein
MNTRGGTISFVNAPDFERGAKASQEAFPKAGLEPRPNNIASDGLIRPKGTRRVVDPSTAPRLPVPHRSSP